MLVYRSPEPGIEELYQTASKIIKSFSQISDREELSLNTSRFVRDLSRAYLEFYNAELAGLSANFHGLRDFYSMCKYIGRAMHAERSPDVRVESVMSSIRRNFGGFIVLLYLESTI